nr:DeoR/GlpR family DNA-binding transcription regulator [uncultured Friedmanniella sp.]
MRYGTAEVRRDELRRRVQRQGYVSSRQVARELQVSDMTIRRDLDQLAEQGLVLRVVGGARRASGTPFAERAVAAAAAKEEVGATCAALFGRGLQRPGLVVALDAGTTVEQVARRLPPGVTVVTHSVPVMAACADRDDLTLIGLGGSYHPPTRSFGGPETRAQLAGLHLDLAVVSASALQERGLFCHDATEADTKRSMLALADHRVVVADASKLSARAPIRIATWEQVDQVVTDDRLSAEERAAQAGWAPDVEVITPSDLGPDQVDAAEESVENAPDGDQS